MCEAGAAGALVACPGIDQNVQCHHGGGTVAGVNHPNSVVECQSVDFGHSMTFIDIIFTSSLGRSARSVSTFSILFDHVHARYDFAEYGVLVVEVRCAAHSRVCLALLVGEFDGAFGCFLLSQGYQFFLKFQQAGLISFLLHLTDLVHAFGCQLLEHALHLHLCQLLLELAELLLAVSLAGDYVELRAR